MWFQGGRSYSRSGSDRETARARLTGSEFAVGGEVALGSAWLAGIAFGYGDHDFKVDARNSKSEVDSYELGLYATRAVAAGPLSPRFTAGVRGGYQTWTAVAPSPTH